MRVSDENRPQEQIIRRLSPPHCARGPKYCSKCREAAKSERICLLRIFHDAGEIARPVIELDRNGQRSFHEYDVLRDFENKATALEFAKSNNITDIDLS